jgi:hypothetical protein
MKKKIATNGKDVKSAGITSENLPNRIVVTPVCHSATPMQGASAEHHNLTVCSLSLPGGQATS